MTKRIFFACLLLLLASCSNEDAYPQLIKGTWALDDTYWTIYADDGTATAYNPSKPESRLTFNYRVINSSLCAKVISTSGIKYTKIGDERCVTIKSLDESELVTELVAIDGDMEENRYVRVR